MKARAIHFSSRFAQVLIFAIVFSCDSLDSDGVHPTLAQTEYYTLPGSSFIIDVTSLAKQSFNTVSLNISYGPTKGVISQVDPLLLKYRPGLEFAEGDDQFVLTVISDGKIVSTQKVKIHIKASKEEFPCSTIAIEDKVQTKPGATISIPILDNDWLCGGDKSSIKISIHSNPKFGEAVVVGDHIVYTPGSAFKALDEIIYKLMTSSSETVYGIISIPELVWLKTSFNGSGIRNLYATADKSILAIAEGSMYKSSDQGDTWKRVNIEPIQKVILHPSGDLYAISGTVYGASECCYPVSIIKSTDHGDTWLTYNISGSDTYLGGFDMSPDGTLQLVVDKCDDNKCLVTLWQSKNGVNWINRSKVSEWNYAATQLVCINNSTTVIQLIDISTWPGWLTLRSIDSGESWTKDLDPTAFGINHVSPIIDNKLYAVTTNSILISYNLGESWEKLETIGFESDCINYINISANGTIYIALYQQGVFKLEGNTWHSVGTELDTENVTSILTIDEDVYVVVEPSSVYRLR